MQPSLSVVCRHSILHRDLLLHVEEVWADGLDRVSYFTTLSSATPQTVYNIAAVSALLSIFKIFKVGSVALRMSSASV